MTGHLDRVAVRETKLEQESHWRKEGGGCQVRQTVPRRIAQEQGLMVRE